MHTPPAQEASASLPAREYECAACKQPGHRRSTHRTCPMNPKRKAAAAALSSASATVPASVTVPVPVSVPAPNPDSVPASVPDPDPATPASGTPAPAPETQACSIHQLQATAINPEAPPHFDKKEDMSEQVDLALERDDILDTPSEHVSPSGTDTAPARSLSSVPTSFVEATGTTSTEPAAALADSSEAILDSVAEPDTDDLSDSSNPTKKRVGPDQHKGGIRGGGAKRRFTNPNPSRRHAG